MRRQFRILLCCATLLTHAALAQKVKVGYDKSIDFSKYKTYSWTVSSTLPSFPNLYSQVFDYINGEMKSKGFTRIDKHGDLKLGMSGGIDLGIATGASTPFVSDPDQAPPSNNATMWTGSEDAGTLSVPVAKGNLRLQFVDSQTNQIVWSGTVAQKLDPEKRDKSMQLIGNALDKLFAQFPPPSK
jgi:hypothetical protein